MRSTSTRRSVLKLNKLTEVINKFYRHVQEFFSPKNSFNFTPSINTAVKNLKLFGSLKWITMAIRFYT